LRRDRNVSSRSDHDSVNETFNCSKYLHTLCNKANFVAKYANATAAAAEKENLLYNARRIMQIYDNEHA